MHHVNISGCNNISTATRTDGVATDCSRRFDSFIPLFAAPSYGQAGWTYRLTLHSSGASFTSGLVDSSEEEGKDDRGRGGHGFHFRGRNAIKVVRKYSYRACDVFIPSSAVNRWVIGVTGNYEPPKKAHFRKISIRPLDWMTGYSYRSPDPRPPTRGRHIGDEICSF